MFLFIKLEQNDINSLTYASGPLSTALLLEMGRVIG